MTPLHDWRSFFLAFRASYSSHQHHRGLLVYPKALAIHLQLLLAQYRRRRKTKPHYNRAEEVLPMETQTIHQAVRQEAAVLEAAVHMTVHEEATRT